MIVGRSTWRPPSRRMRRAAGVVASLCFVSLVGISALAAQGSSIDLPRPIEGQLEGPEAEDASGRSTRAPNRCDASDEHTDVIATFADSLKRDRGRRRTRPLPRAVGREAHDQSCLARELAPPDQPRAHAVEHSRWPLAVASRRPALVTAEVGTNTNFVIGIDYNLWRQRTM